MTIADKTVLVTGANRGIGQALVEINTVGAEAERERSARLSRQPGTGPLCRTLLRLRHDLVMVGRTAGAPLPEAIQVRIEPRLGAVASAARDFLQMSGNSLLAEQGPPTLGPLEAALGAYNAEVGAIRRDGLVRAFPSEAAERFFAVGFVLEQMHRNLLDLARVVTEWSPAGGQEEAS